MMYSNKFVMCVKVNGQIQKEKSNGTVIIPFGSEYELRFRNKNSRRAVVKIYIDGENVSGPGYVVNTNDYVDIKRHHDKDRSFKFVSLDSPDAYEHGKNGPNDDKVKGTIEARFYLEKETPPPTVHLPIIQDHHHYHPPKIEPWRCPTVPVVEFNKALLYRGRRPFHSPQYTCGDYQAKESSILNRTTFDEGSVSCSLGESQTLQHLNSNSPVIQDGCTVEGVASGQIFGTTYIDTEETYTSLKLFLQGYQPEVQTVETNEGPKTVVQNDPNQDTKYCSDCGTKVVKNTAKFCHNCGSKL